MSSDTPSYTIKISQRSRTVRLQISKETGLVITVPRGFNQRLLPDIINSKLDWINKTFEHVENLPPDKKDSLPKKLELKATNETWLVVYRTEPGVKLHLEEQPRRKVLIISGKTNAKSAVHRLLKSWIKDRASHLLPDWIERISRKTGLQYQKITIRDQKTRWGSCSSLKNINLNLKLIFLPPHLVDYVITHELCHTQVLSHSAAFWKLVSEYYPDYKEARKQIRSIATKIPV